MAGTGGGHMCGGNGWMWHSAYGGGWGWAGWLATAVVMVTFFALVITGIAVAVRYLADGGNSPIRHPDGNQLTEQLLSERFARGEIDDEEYRRRMTTLREHR